MRDTVQIDDEIESGLAAISDVVANASTCFDIWFEIQNGSKRDTYEPVVEAYPVFFETAVIAHLIAISTLTYSLLETRNDTHNLPGLMRALRRTGKNEAQLSAIEAKLETIRPTWAKVSRIRNEVFGHRSRARFPVQVFEELQLRPEEIGQFIQDIKVLVSDLASLFGTIVSSALSISAMEETTDLMSVLAKYHAP
jgi:AbiU2